MSITNVRIYADYAASAPLRPTALDAMHRALTVLAAHGGNPSSPHRAGAGMRAALERARASIAAAIGAEALELVLTSGATEANNLALWGTARSAADTRLAVAVSDHASVLAPARALQAAGATVTFLPVDASGRIDPAGIAAARPTLVSLSLVNAETAIVQDVTAVTTAARACGALVHFDAAQATAALPVDVRTLGADLLTLSAHKVGGPPGAGALYVRRGIEMHGTQRGGAQERGLRAGTENVPAAAGFAAALEEAVAGRPTEALRLRVLTGQLRDALVHRWPTARFTAATAPEVAPHIVNVAFPGYDAEALVSALDLEGVAASAGSACAAGGTEPSHVLQAMGWSAIEATSALRLSFGWASTAADVTGVVERLGVVLGRVAPRREAAWPARAS